MLKHGATIGGVDGAPSIVNRGQEVLASQTSIASAKAHRKITAAIVGGLLAAVGLTSEIKTALGPAGSQRSGRVSREMETIGYCGPVRAATASSPSLAALS